MYSKQMTKENNMSHLGEALVVLFIICGIISCHAIDSGVVNNYQVEKTKQKQLELEIKKIELKKAVEQK